MKLHTLALAVLAAASVQAHADTVALWDFNSFACTSACTTMPKATQTANGGVLSAVGGITFTSAAGSGTGSALNTSTYAAQGTGNLTRGVQFLIDTSGYTNLVLTFAERSSNTASGWTTLRYTVDGSHWVTAASYQMPTANAGTSFVNGLTYDFSSVAGANDNAAFGIQLLASFAPNTNAYAAAGASASYGTGGTIRYDNVLLSGTAIPDTLPVPEPESYALMLAGLAVVTLVARRRLPR